MKIPGFRAKQLPVLSINKYTNILIKYIFLILTFIILCNIFFSKLPTNNRAVYSNFLIASVASCFIAAVIVMKNPANGLICKLCHPRLNKRQIINDKTVLMITMCIYIILIYIWYNIYYKSGSDLWTIDYTARVLLNECTATGDIQAWLNHYYSLYPNNILLTCLYTAGLWINKYFGVLDVENGLMILITFNTLISCITIYLIYLYIKFLGGGYELALLGWLLGLIMIGLNPYNILPYSDSISIIFPVAILILYRKSENKSYLWIVIMFVGICAYHIKPQSAIMLIVTIFHEITLLFTGFKIKKLVTQITYIVIGILLATSFYAFVTTKFSEKIITDSDKNLPATHWIMMGMNEEAIGGYSGDDIAFSSRFDTVNARKNAEIKEIKNRLKKFGCINYINFLNKKIGKVFCDGTFNYSTSTGDWYDVVYDNKNAFISPALRKIFYYTEDWFPIYSTIMQFVWTSIMLVCFIGNLFQNIYEKNDNIILLYIIGIILFELIFEGQARHLYGSVPIFIVCSVNGLNNINIYYIKFCYRRFLKSK